MKYIDADRLKVETEKRMHICDGIFERDSDTYYQGKAVAYQETLSLIDSLQQEQPYVDIREEIKKLDFMGSNDARDILHVAEHFYELGLKAK